ncbi:SDR family NAD(P)-dependent oxidoreductase [Bradyrhizobium sp. AZCC 2289]|uniref:SDR family NAD(P)-dependent oxidoreductase n=1 Tax=Bradyrhizobium sp. AZCC 2289 TaxID=3117026 RepID=UPI002FF3512C
MSAPAVLITGALTGISRATALAFAQEGARTFVSGRHDEAGHALTCELRCDAIRTGEQRQLHKCELFKGNLSYSVPVSGAHNNAIA